MTSNCRRVGRLVTKMQDAFLDVPSATLTLLEAQERFGMTKDTCEGVLGALVDARVLAMTPDGKYARRFPRARVSRTKHAA